MLELKNITKIYNAVDNEVRALNDVSVSFRKNEFVCILGPSGCGKTTMLNIVGGLDRYTEGDLVINGVSTKEYTDRNWDTYRNHSIGFVFQSYNLISHLSILSNVEMALSLAGVSKAERYEKARIALEKVGLADKMDKKPNQLSGGQMQRVAIARALVNDPDIILADEPTGALDSETGIQVIDLLEEVAKDRLVIMVTHNDVLAEKYATRIIKLLDGKIIGDTNPYESETELVVSAPKEKQVAMSFWTAFVLSVKNLVSKKGRTILTSFAGSIGIFGICIVLAISNGMSNYIAKMQRDSMDQAPITIMQSAMKSDAISLLQGTEVSLEEYPQNTTGIYPHVALSMTDMTIPNKITQDYVDDCIETIPKELITAISYSYSLGLRILTENNGTHTRVPETTDLTTNYSEMLDSSAAIGDTYDVLKGSMPSAYNELAIVVDSYNRLPTSILTALGIPFDDNTVEISYETLLNKEFKLILNDEYYTKGADGLFSATSNTQYESLYNNENAVTLKIVGVLRQKEDATASWLSSGLVYTKALTDFVISDSIESEIGKAQIASTTSNVLTGNDFIATETRTVEQLHTSAVQALGATKLPVSIYIYSASFEAKDEILAHLDAWNADKAEADQIHYTDVGEMLLSMLSTLVDIITYVLIAFSAVSLVVSSIMIAITTYASVVERTKEIGVLRSLGARKKDISRIFNVETMIIGLVAGLIGVVFTLLISIPINLILGALVGVTTIASLNLSSAVIMILISVALTLIAGLIPAGMAARKDPVVALRTE